MALELTIDIVTYPGGFEVNGDVWKPGKENPKHVETFTYTSTNGVYPPTLHPKIQKIIRWVLNKKTKDHDFYYVFWTKETCSLHALEISDDPTVANCPYPGFELTPIENVTFYPRTFGITDETPLPE